MNVLGSNGNGCDNGQAKDQISLLSWGLSLNDEIDTTATRMSMLMIMKERKMNVMIPTLSWGSCSLMCWQPDCLMRSPASLSGYFLSFPSYSSNFFLLWKMRHMVQTYTQRQNKTLSSYSPPRSLSSQILKKTTNCRVWKFTLKGKPRHYFHIHHLDHDPQENLKLQGL